MGERLYEGMKMHKANFLMRATRQHYRFSALLLTGCGLAIQFHATTAHAQAADSGGFLEEIVVTAQKQTEKLSDVTVSAAVVSADNLTTSGVTTLDDIGKAVPSLSAAPSTSTLRSAYTMRGISTTVITPGAPSGTAIMIDGVTLAPESMAARQLGDIESVEVLRGPQSTLGGRTAESGVVNIVTRSPTQTFTGNASLTVTNDNQQRVQAFVAGPIADTVSFSLSGYNDSLDYPTKNLATGKHDSEDSSGVRGKLLFKPTDALDITLSASYAKSKSKGTFSSYVAIDPTANFRGSAQIPQSVALPGITVSRDNLDYSVIGSPYMKGIDKLYSLVLNYKLGDFTLSSITARQEENRTLLFDVYDEAANSAAILAPPLSWDMKQTSILKVRTTSQEFKLITPQLGFVNVLAGLYFDHDVTDFDFVRLSYTNGGSGPPPFIAFRVPDTKTYAAYARATWTLVPDKLDLITGARINRDEIAYTYNLRQNVSTAPQITPFTRTDSFKENTTVGDITLRYRFDPDVMVYGGYTRGYKPAIWNLDGTVTTNNTFVPVKKETVDSFEVGLKGSFLDHRLSLNAAVFNTKYKNFQVQTFDPNATSATFAIGTADAHTRGVELDARAILPAEFRLNAGIAYVDAKYDSYPRANCYGTQTAAQGCVPAAGGKPAYQSLTGQRLNNAPQWKGNIGLEKLVRFDRFNLTLNGNYTYQTKVIFDPNMNPYASQDAYGILNVGATISDQNDRYSATLFLNNALDEHYLVGATDQTARWGNKLAITGNWTRDAERYAGIRLTAKY
jgi:iron complex outermembrane receptor protein